jgi:hypothetical protein
MLVHCGRDMTTRCISAQMQSALPFEGAIPLPPSLVSLTAARSQLHTSASVVRMKSYSLPPDLEPTTSNAVETMNLHAVAFRWISNDR